jgi:hypothetical protein
LSFSSPRLTTRFGLLVLSGRWVLSSLIDLTGLSLLSDRWGLPLLSGLSSRSGLIDLPGFNIFFGSLSLSGLLLLSGLGDRSASPDLDGPEDRLVFVFLSDRPVFMGLDGLSLFIYSSSFSYAGLIFTPS